MTIHFSLNGDSRQTVFYTPETITISEGDEITGRLSCSPNERNNRDLDITIAYEAPSDDKDGLRVEKETHYKMCVISLLVEAFFSSFVPSVILTLSTSPDLTWSGILD